MPLFLLAVGYLFFMLSNAGSLSNNKQPPSSYMNESETEIRAAYKTLSTKDQAVYTALYRGVANFEEHIDLPYTLDENDYERIYLIFEKNEPEFFYLSSSFYNANKVTTAKVAYQTNKDSAVTMRDELETVRDRVLRGTSNCITDFDKALYIHDYIIDNCVYSLNGSENISNAYGCLVEGKALCEGYAKGFSYLLNAVGIENIIITGTTHENELHAWNQIKIDGKWYNSDITWNDDDDSNDIGRYGARHVYFACDDKSFGQTHFADAKFLKKFECNVANLYYKTKDLYVSDMSECERILKKELKISGMGRLIELQFADEANYGDFVRTCIKEELIFNYLKNNDFSILPNANNLIWSEYEKQLCVLMVLL